MVDKTYNVLHTTNLGDSIYSLPAFRALYSRTGIKTSYYQMTNRLAHYYPGATHPVSDDHGNTVNFSRGNISMMRPLMQAQEFIHQYNEWNGESYTYNLDRIRQDFPIDLTKGNIQQWIFYAYPELWCDTSKPWLSVPYNESLDEIAKGKIVVSFTSRYRNESIHYFLLRKCVDELLFLGTEQEARTFGLKWGIPYVPSVMVDDFLELAQIIKQGKFFIGNQSFAYAIAEAIGKPRLLESSPKFHNVHPMTPNGRAYLFQSAFERLFADLYSKEEIKPQLISLWQ